MREVEARANKATPGPWETDGGQIVETVEPIDCDTDCADVCEVIHRGVNAGACKNYTAQFIAHARTDIPCLIAIVREQRRTIEREVLLDLLDRMGDGSHVMNPNGYAHLDADGIRKRIFEFVDYLKEHENGDLRDRLAKLEKAYEEIVTLRDECAVDPTTVVNRSLQKLDTEIVQMSVLLNEKSGA